MSPKDLKVETFFLKILCLRFIFGDSVRVSVRNKARRDKS